MKRLMSILLALVMVLGLSTTALADDTTTNANGTVAAQTVTLNKVYNTATGAPAETLTLTYTGSAETTNTGVNVPALTNLTNNKITGTSSNGITTSFSFGLPAYTTPGVYEYYFTEYDNGSAGVTYFNGTIVLRVNVYFDNGTLTSSYEFLSRTTNSDGTYSYVKLNGNLTNTYVAGSLKVIKTVTGNLGDKNKSFEIKVTFTSTEVVRSTITYGNNSIAPTAWTTVTDDNGNTTGYKAEVTISLANGENVTFSNIPSGVSYVVEETDSSVTSGEYTVTYDNSKTGTISSTAVETTVTNNKSQNVSTGITMDSMPYIVLMVACVVGLGLFVVSKKRRVE